MKSLPPLQLSAHSDLHLLGDTRLPLDLAADVTSQAWPATKGACTVFQTVLGKRIAIADHGGYDDVDAVNLGKHDSLHFALELFPALSTRN